MWSLDEKDLRISQKKNKKIIVQAYIEFCSAIKNKQTKNKVNLKLKAAHDMEQSEKTSNITV